MDQESFTTEPQPSIRKRNEHVDESAAEFEKEYHERNRRERENLFKRRLIDAVGGIKAYQDFTIEKFDGTRAPQAHAAALRFDPNRDNLYFWGPPRVGKTHLAVGLARPLIERRQPVLLWTLPRLKNAFHIFESKHDYVGKKELWDQLSAATILVIHELGKGPILSDFLHENLWLVLEERILKGRNGLIITSNFSLDEIGQKYGGTISERIAELCGPENVILFPPKRGPR